MPGSVELTVTSTTNTAMTSTTTDDLFFDSHGGLWAVCAADHPAAQAFGPRGAARLLGRNLRALFADLPTKPTRRIHRQRWATADRARKR